VLDNIKTRLTEFGTANDIVGEASLVFNTPPLPTDSPAESPTPTASGDLNTGRFALSYGVDVNARIIAFEEWLFMALPSLDKGLEHPTSSIRLRTRTLKMVIESELAAIERLKMEHWERQRNDAVQRANSERKAPSESVSFDTCAYNYMSFINARLM
jgi:hypothetical protein